MHEVCCISLTRSAILHAELPLLSCAECWLLAMYLFICCGAGHLFRCPDVYAYLQSLPTHPISLRGLVQEPVVLDMSSGFLSCCRPAAGCKLRDRLLHPACLLRDNFNAKLSAYSCYESLCWVATVVRALPASGCIVEFCIC